MRGQDKHTRGQIITLINKTTDCSVVPEMKHMAKKTNDASQVRQEALKFFAEAYYQKPSTFSDILTNVRINGRVGWSCGENMMSGTVIVEKNAGSTFGAAIRGGDLVCKGSVGARTGIDMKGGTIIIGGDAGAFTGFMMQRGRIIILGDVGINLGDSMYDGTIFIGGQIGSYGSDAVDSELTKSDQDWLKRKLKVAEIGENFDVSKMKKIVAGKKLWNYDNLEPTEKKGAI